MVLLKLNSDVWYVMHKTFIFILSFPRFKLETRTLLYEIRARVQYYNIRLFDFAHSAISLHHRRLWI